MKKLVIMACAALVLSACENTREQFKLSKEAPDEFAVIKRAPLEMPPDMTALPAPNPGAPRPQEQTPTAMARASILSDAAAKAPENATHSEVILLQKAGAASVPANIRKQVDAETAAIAAEETPTIDRILKVTGKKVEAPAVEVDPVAEANRIKANKAAGRPVTEGETAVKEDE